MKDYLRYRTLENAQCLLDHQTTVRGVAKKTGNSKTMVHTDVTERLQQIDSSLYSAVKTLLAKNWVEKHTRGGQAKRQTAERRKRKCK